MKKKSQNKVSKHTLLLIQEMKGKRYQTVLCCEVKNKQCISLSDICVLSKNIMGPISLKIFSPTICKLIIILCCNSIPSHLITTKFCTCHDSSTVMVCTKFGGNQNFNIIKTWIPNILYILGISWLAGKNCTWNGFPAPAYQRLLRKVSKGSQISHVIAIIR